MPAGNKEIHQPVTDAFIAVVGCYAQLKPQEISAIPGVDLVLGINEKFDIAGYLTDHLKRNRKLRSIHADSLLSDRFNPFIFSR